MSYSVRLEKVARDRQKSREIVKEILDFGVNEQQKFDVIHGLVLTLENNQALKELTKLLKNYRENINKEEDSDNNIKEETKSKLILD